VHAARSLLCSTRALTPAVLEDAYKALEREVTEALLAQGQSRALIELVRTVDVHYAGQSFELSLEMQSPTDTAAIVAIDNRFAAEHERTYGHRADDDPVEVVHIRVQGRVPARPVSRSAMRTTSRPESTRHAFFGPQYGLLQTPVIQRDNFEFEFESESEKTSPRNGPLIVEEYDATTLVPPGWTIRRDDRDNLFIERS